MRIKCITQCPKCKVVTFGAVFNHIKATQGRANHSLECMCSRQTSTCSKAFSQSLDCVEDTLVLQMHASKNMTCTNLPNPHAFKPILVQGSGFRVYEKFC